MCVVVVDCFVLAALPVGDIVVVGVDVICCVLLAASVLLLVRGLAAAVLGDGSSLSISCASLQSHHKVYCCVGFCMIWQALSTSPTVCLLAASYYLLARGLAAAVLGDGSLLSISRASPQSHHKVYCCVGFCVIWQCGQ